MVSIYKIMVVGTAYISENIDNIENHMEFCRCHSPCLKNTFTVL